MDRKAALAKSGRGLNPCGEALWRERIVFLLTDDGLNGRRWTRPSGSQFEFARKSLNSHDPRKKEAWISLSRALKFLPKDLDFPS
jgi:hypothetical protein